MTNKIALVIATLALVLGGVAFHRSDAPLRGQLYELDLVQFVKGIRLGQTVVLTKEVTIGVGANQAAWTNNLGRTVYVDPLVRFGYESGTASSSQILYVGTSTATTFADYARPTPATLIIDGALVATSTATAGGPNTYVGTTTSTGVGFAVPAGSSIIFDVQERFACKANGACETATSTNRGIASYKGWFTIRY